MSLPIEESDYLFCDLQEIVRYIRRHNPEAAIRFVLAVRATAETLSRSPHIGHARSDIGFPEVRSWRISGFRTYLIFYKPTADRLLLLRVLHGNRDLETELEK